jgi:hypothetical protein
VAWLHDEVYDGFHELISTALTEVVGTTKVAGSRMPKPLRLAQELAQRMDRRYRAITDLELNFFHTGRYGVARSRPADISTWNKEATMLAMAWCSVQQGLRALTGFFLFFFGRPYGLLCINVALYYFK